MRYYDIARNCLQSAQHANNPATRDKLLDPGAVVDGRGNERNVHRHDRCRLDEGGTSSDVAHAFQASRLF